MANEEQLAILRQGVEVWNKWREKNSGIKIDLRVADLSKINLSESNLQGVDLGGASLNGANLILANLTSAYLKKATFHEARLNLVELNEANLRNTDFRMANLSGAHLTHVDLSEADFRGAILSTTDLRGANLSAANLSHADLSEANLFGANLSRAVLDETNLFDAVIGYTIFGNSDISRTLGLEDLRHSGPSIVSTDVFALSKGNIPSVFLRGSGSSDWEVELVKLYNPGLSNNEITNIQYKMYDLRATQALQISPLFISYSHGDSTFVDKLESQLNEKGVRFWRDIHDMKAGRIEKQIDRAISQNRTVLLILSENSLKSDWVEHEVRMTRGLEKDMERDVLCPVALDDSWKSSRWPKRIMEQIMEYNILDFSAWEDDVKFEGMFRKLIDGLELFYKG